MLYKKSQIVYILHIQNFVKGSFNEYPNYDNCVRIRAKQYDETHQKMHLIKSR